MSSEDQNYEIEDGVTIQAGAVVGFKYKPDAGPAKIAGPGSVVRRGATIYGDVQIGDHFQSGHNITIRPRTRLGRYVVIGTNTVIDGDVDIADFVKIETNCYIPTHVSIATRCFLGPNVVLTNDRLPLKDRANYKPEGPILEEGVTLGGGVTVCPGVRIGAGSFVAAGAVVTKDVPPMTLVKGNPGRFSPLPDALRERNIALNWMGIID